MAEASMLQQPQKISQSVNTAGKKSDINAEPSRPTPNKRMSAARGALAALIIVLLILIGAGVAVFFNVADSRMMLVSFLQSADPIVGQEFDAFEAERTALMAERSELGTQQAALEAEKTRLGNLDKQLSRRERVLREAEESQVLDEESIAKAAQDREKMISIISKLDAPAAARMLASLQDTREIVNILLVLKEKFAAAILTAMDPVVATRVVKEALNRNESAAFLQGLPYELLPDETTTPTPTPLPTPTPSAAGKTTVRNGAKPASSLIRLPQQGGGSE